MTLRYLSLFSGIEEATVALKPLGWECVAVSEIEKFPCELLAQHYPGVPNLGDVTKVTEADIANLGRIDLVVFGSPCQDLSVAGKRKGLDGARSGLFFTALDIIGWAREWGGCRFALWENVPGAFSSHKGADFAAVVDALAGLDGTETPPKGWGTEGCAVGPEAMVEWATLDAQWFGVAQRRRRVFALADFGDWPSRPPILLESEGLRGDSAPSRSKGQGVAGVVATGTRSGCEQRSVLIPSTGDVSHCLNAGGMGRIDYETETMVVCATGDVAHTLRGEGFDASEDGTGRGVPIVACSFTENQRGEVRTSDIAGAPSTGGGKPGQGYPAVCIGFHHNAQAAQLPGVGRDTSKSDPLTCSQQAAVVYAIQAGAFNIQVRRLTPVECERLQGFPDNHTAVLVRDKPAADGPRYKALGNSMCVNVMHWIGREIDFVWRFF